MVPRDDHPLSDLKPTCCSVITNLDHLSDRLMPDCERRWKRRAPRNDVPIKVTRRRRDRAHQGVLAVKKTRFRRFAPLDIAGTHVDQASHRESLTTTGASVRILQPRDR